MWIRVCSECGDADFHNAWGRAIVLDDVRPFACRFCAASAFTTAVLPIDPAAIVGESGRRIGSAYQR